MADSAAGMAQQVWARASATALMVLALTSCSVTSESPGGTSRVAEGRELLGALYAASPSEEIDPFVTDGCSLFPFEGGHDKNPRHGLRDCCIEHDKLYWRGGTASARLDADRELRACVTERSGAFLATLMYAAVRLAGGPGNGTYYRWGYGWPYLILYRPLSDAQRRSADRRMAEYERGRRSGKSAGAP